MQIIVLILWFIYACLEGYREGDYWYARNLIPIYNKGKLMKEPHSIWFTQRFLCGIMLTLTAFYCHYDVFSLLYLIGLGLCFPVFHDGLYYIRRNNIDKSVYKSRFFDYSITSTAFMTFTFEIRLMLFIIGMIFCSISIFTINK